MRKIIIKIIDKLFPNTPKMTCCGCPPEKFKNCPYKPKKGEYNLYCYCYGMKDRKCNDFATYMMLSQELQEQDMEELFNGER